MVGRGLGPAAVTPIFDTSRSLRVAADYSACCGATGASACALPPHLFEHTSSCLVVDVASRVGVALADFLEESAEAFL
ncbi:MAG: hypothetical protein AAF492_25005, partial [Verrucomicrobiota bacterium]